MQPNSLNFLKFPLIAMFWNMIFYMSPPMCAHLRCVRCCLAFFTDCGFFSAEPKLDMVECGQAHEDPPWASHVATTGLLWLLHLPALCPARLPGLLGHSAW